MTVQAQETPPQAGSASAEAEAGAFAQRVMTDCISGLTCLLIENPSDHHHRDQDLPPARRDRRGDDEDPPRRDRARQRDVLRREADRQGRRAVRGPVRRPAVHGEH